MPTPSIRVSPESYSAPLVRVNVLLAYATNMLAVAATSLFASRRAMSKDGARPKSSSSAEAKQVGAALRMLRMQRNLSQEEAADLAEVSRTAWQNYENGRAVVLRTDIQASLAKALGATRSDLLALLREGQRGGGHSGLEETGAIYSGPGRQQAIFPLAEGDVIISYPAGLSPQGREELAAYLELFLKRGRE